MIYEMDFRGTNGGPAKRIAWATDLHFDAADRAQHRLFCDLVVAHEPDLILIGGDISNGSSSLVYLQQLSQLIKKPFYFVLGNHDFYHGSIDKIREMAHEISKEHPSLNYLTHVGIFTLSDKTALIGHDGWADGRAGDFLNSNIMLNDYYLIDELKKLNQEEKLIKLNELGSEAAEYFKKTLLEGFKTYDRIIALTHVPPFLETCLYEGKICDANWAPHFVCQALGDVFKEVMLQHPEKNLLVLCGHSHSGNDLEVLPNLRVVTGQTELGNPNVQGLILVN